MDDMHLEVIVLPIDSMLRRRMEMELKRCEFSSAIGTIRESDFQLWSQSIFSKIICASWQVDSLRDIIGPRAERRLDWEIEIVESNESHDVWGGGLTWFQIDWTLLLTGVTEGILRFDGSPVGTKLLVVIVATAGGESRDSHNGACEWILHICLRFPVNTN